MHRSDDSTAPVIDRSRRATGCLLGAAIGDAFARPTEFLSFEQIVSRWPPHGPTELVGAPALVTDDTQMMLAVGEALVASLPASALTASRLEGPLRRAFVAWLNDPENNRAPGQTCLRACRRLEQGRSWIEATEPASKGCGANMRVQPVGLLAAIAPGLRGAVAQFQSALTHGHPTALAASELTALAIAELLDGCGPDALLARLLDHARAARERYHADWLGDLWRVAGANSPEAFMACGWDECHAALAAIPSALAGLPPDADPCLATGAGWIAEEALATGLLCFALTPDDPATVVRRAAASSGDSDSIACLAGAFAGAHAGRDGWPADWIARIEHGPQLAALADALAAPEQRPRATP